jgi:RimJ/RimL family protein N-acetyltransferase
MKGRSLRDTVGLIRQNLYISEPIQVFRQEINAQPDDLSERIDGVTIEKGDLEHLAQAARALQPLPWEFQCHSFDGVADFFIARNQDGVQHISWIYYHDDRNRLLTLGHEEAEIKFCLTLPPMRGKGIYPIVIRSIVEYLGSKGLENVYMCVHRDNRSSIRGIEKAGFRYAGELRFKKVLGIQVSSRFDTTTRQ